MARIYLYMAFPPLLPTRHSGEAEDMSADTPTARPPNLLGWAALVVVYVVWGSTYLAIRVGVRDLPPLTMAGVRYLAAGVLLYPIALRTGGPTVRRTDKPGGRQWLGAALVGLLLLVLGNGGLSIGEQSLDSGFAAVLVATVPLWMVLLAWPIDRTRPTRRSLTGLTVGLVGVAVLAGAGSTSGHLAGIAVVLGASAAWALGSVLARRLALPRRALVAAAAEMIAGGVLLLIAAAIHGDYSRIHWSHVPTSGWLALLYLIGPGSVLAFTAYGYALSHLPLATVSTYAYVNPVVAVLLGVTILGEPLTTVELIGTGLVVASVMLTLRHRIPPDDPKHEEPPAPPRTAAIIAGMDQPPDAGRSSDRVQVAS
jgi:drug/metabolite transporter (DMT)-like permease